MVGFGPCLIPDRFHLANQATLTRGVRLSLAERWAWACCRLWVSWAQTLSKRPDVSRARTVRTPWPPARPHLWPLRLQPGVDDHCVCRLDSPGAFPLERS